MLTVSGAASSAVLTLRSPRSGRLEGCCSRSSGPLTRPPMVAASGGGRVPVDEPPAGAHGVVHLAGRAGDVVPRRLAPGQHGARVVHLFVVEVSLSYRGLASRCGR